MSYPGSGYQQVENERIALYRRLADMHDGTPTGVHFATIARQLSQRLRATVAQRDGTRSGEYVLA